MIDEDRLLRTFLDLVRIDSPSGHEAAIGAHLLRRLEELGGQAERDLHGNVMGRWAGAGEPLLLSAHMDVVGPCTGVRPQVRDGVVYSDGTTTLGADDKSGIAVILELLEVLR